MPLLSRGRFTSHSHLPFSRRRFEEGRLQKLLERQNLETASHGQPAHLGLKLGVIADGGGVKDAVSVLVEFNTSLRCKGCCLY